MIISTTPSIENKKIIKYLGIVSGETIVAANFLQNWLSGLRALVGGRSNSYEEVLEKARMKSILIMKEKALKMGANAILGTHIDCETVGFKNTMFLISNYGTAVILE